MISIFLSEMITDLICDAVCVGWVQGEQMNNMFTFGLTQKWIL